MSLTFFEPTRVRPAKPLPRTRRKWNELGIQVVLIGAAVLLYFAVRGLTEADEATAVKNGFDVLGFERAWGLDIEANLQSWTLRHHAIVTATNWVYIWGHWPVIAASLVWLHRTQRDQFLRLRNALFISGAIGLVIFASYPVAPPRLLGAGMVDTVTVWSHSYRVLQPPSLVNKYAALPSLHVGFNLLVGLALYRASSRRGVRLLGVMSPLAMVVAVVLTANHYVVDAAAGIVVALVGWALAGALSGAARNLVPGRSSDEFRM